MPINLLGSTSQYVKNKNDTTSFARKPASRTKYIESIFEEVIDLKNQFEIKQLHSVFFPTRSKFEGSC